MKKIIKKTFCFDLDNTLCKTINSNYLKSKPNLTAIKMVNKLYENGHCIKIFTARYMGRNNDNISKANKMGYQKTFNQLKRWKIKFNKLIMSKPSADIYIDDKSWGYNKNGLKNLKNFLN